MLAFFAEALHQSSDLMNHMSEPHERVRACTSLTASFVTPASSQASSSLTRVDICVLHADSGNKMTACRGLTSGAEVHARKA